MLKKIYFRADGNSKIGLGHLIRSLALAEMLQPEFNCCFLVKQSTSEVLAQIQEPIGIHQLHSENLTDEASEICALLQHQPGILVLDGYQFNSEFQLLVKKGNTKLVCIDDLHDQHFYADGIINQAGSITEKHYSMEPETRLLAGPAYSLLRKPFLKAAKSKNPALNLDRLFLNMGGADLANDTLQLLKQLNTINSFFSEVNIVVGAGYQFLDSLYDQINEKSGYYIHRNLTAEQMSALMQTCGVAICPPSGVSYEYCTAKGILFLKQTAGNQTGIFDFLITSRLALPFSEFDNYISQPELMRSTAVALITNQARIFDGKAPDRFKAYFKSL